MKPERILEMLKGTKYSAYMEYGHLPETDPKAELAHKALREADFDKFLNAARAQLLAKALREAESKLEQCKGKCEGVVDVLMNIEDALKEAGLEG